MSRYTSPEHSNSYSYAHLDRAPAQQAVRHIAQEKDELYCYIQGKDVMVLVQYPDYVNYRNKGPRGAVYCSEIHECYNNRVKCKYSGISPYYTDPFVPPVNDEEIFESLNELEEKAVNGELQNS